MFYNFDISQSKQREVLASFELTTFCVLSRRDNHYTTEPLIILIGFQQPVNIQFWNFSIKTNEVQVKFESATFYMLLLKWIPTALQSCIKDGDTI